MKSITQVIRSRDVVFKPKHPRKTLTWFSDRQGSSDSLNKEHMDASSSSSFEDLPLQNLSPEDHHKDDQLTKIPKQQTGFSHNLHNRNKLKLPVRLVELLLVKIDEPSSSHIKLSQL